MIIAIEGIDGAGKNTIVKRIVEEYGADTLSFPRYEDSLHAQLAQDALYGKMGDLVDSAYGMATMFALDRFGAKAQLEQYQDTPDRILLLDRYVASNAAYTAARTGDDAAAEWVAELEFGKLGLPKPDLQVLVATAPSVARERAQRREAQDATRTRDHYERDGGLQDATFAQYNRLAETDWASRWISTSDATAIIQAIQSAR
ncbi:dTMP kinase [Corynebacterium sp. CCUG 61414]|uniref:dTMP kinase n=1 Tax=Corynebacterium sp. CCUG 61414 TaxID=2823896 RepID=UPI00210BB96C|nr:dTMP kinase [Corynebacterium sp. CCUG 61414]MCQ4609721.1 dTMP kinase [Corynebacterium sp. CCUG 61414]